MKKILLNLIIFVLFVSTAKRTFASKTSKKSQKPKGLLKLSAQDVTLFRQFFPKQRKKAKKLISETMEKFPIQSFPYDVNFEINQQYPRNEIVEYMHNFENLQLELLDIAKDYFSHHHKVKKPTAEMNTMIKRMRMFFMNQNIYTRILGPMKRERELFLLKKDYASFFRLKFVYYAKMKQYIEGCYLINIKFRTYCKHYLSSILPKLGEAVPIGKDNYMLFVFTVVQQQMRDQERALELRGMSKSEQRKQLHSKDRDIIDIVNNILEKQKRTKGEIDADNVQLANQMMSDPIVKANLLNYYKIEDIVDGEDKKQQIQKQIEQIRQRIEKLNKILKKNKYDQKSLSEISTLKDKMSVFKQYEEDEEQQEEIKRNSGDLDLSEDDEEDVKKNSGDLDLSEDEKVKKNRNDINLSESEKSKKFNSVELSGEQRQKQHLLRKKIFRKESVDTKKPKNWVNPKLRNQAFEEIQRENPLLNVPEKEQFKKVQPKYLQYEKGTPKKDFLKAGSYKIPTMQFQEKKQKQPFKLQYDTEKNNEFRKWLEQKKFEKKEKPQKIDIDVQEHEKKMDDLDRQIQSLRNSDKLKNIIKQQKDYKKQEQFEIPQNLSTIERQDTSFNSSGAYKLQENIDKFLESPKRENFKTFEEYEDALQDYQLQQEMMENENWDALEKSFQQNDQKLSEIQDFKKSLLQVNDEELEQFDNEEQEWSEESEEIDQDSPKKVQKLDLKFSPKFNLTQLNDKQKKILQQRLQNSNLFQKYKKNQTTENTPEISFDDKKSKIKDDFDIYLNNEKNDDSFEDNELLQRKRNFQKGPKKDFKLNLINIDQDDKEEQDTELLNIKRNRPKLNNDFKLNLQKIGDKIDSPQEKVKNIELLEPLFYSDSEKSFDNDKRIQNSPIKSDSKDILLEEPLLTESEKSIDYDKKIQNSPIKSETKSIEIHEPFFDNSEKSIASDKRIQNSPIKSDTKDILLDESPLTDSEKSIDNDKKIQNSPIKSEIKNIEIHEPFQEKSKIDPFLTVNSPFIQRYKNIPENIQNQINSIDNTKKLLNSKFSDLRSKQSSLNSSFKSNGSIRDQLKNSNRSILTRKPDPLFKKQNSKSSESIDMGKYIKSPETLKFQYEKQKDSPIKDKESSLSEDEDSIEKMKKNKKSKIDDSDKKFKNDDISDNEISRDKFEDLIKKMENSKKPQKSKFYLDSIKSDKFPYQDLLDIKNAYKQPGKSQFYHNRDQKIDSSEEKSPTKEIISHQNSHIYDNPLYDAYVDYKDTLKRKDSYEIPQKSLFSKENRDSSEEDSLEKIKNHSGLIENWNIFDPSVEDLFKQDKKSLLKTENPQNTLKPSKIEKSHLSPSKMTQSFYEKPREINVIVIEILTCKKCEEYELMQKIFNIKK